MAAVVAMSAAALAYRKASQRARDKTNKTLPPWLHEFRDLLPEIKGLEDEGEEPASPGSPPRSPKKGKETVAEIKEAEMKDKDDPYLKLAWAMHEKVTSKNWFEGFVMLNILMIGLATGLDLQFADDPNPGVTGFVDVTGLFTMVVFTLECVCKLVAEGYRPDRYFTDAENGAFVRAPMRPPSMPLEASRGLQRAHCFECTHKKPPFCKGTLQPTRF